MRGASVIIVALLLGCPLAWWPGTGFDAVRLPVVLGLTGALLAVAFARAARGGERPPGPAPLRTAGLLLLGVHVLALFAARSLADAAVPLLVLFAGVAIFSCLRGGVLRPEPAAALLPAIPVVGLAFASIGLVQALLGSQAVSTEGNRNYSGALSAMLLPAAVALTRTGPGWSRIVSGIAAVGLLGLLLLSESRGGIVAAFAGIAIAGAAMGARKVGRGALAAVAALVLLGGAFGAFQAARQFSRERLETAGVRIEIWKSGLRMVAARPVLGWGPGNFSIEYPLFRSETEFQASHRYVPDAFKEVEDAHSSVVQIGVETGVPGLLALLLVVYVAARLWRYYVKTAPDGDRAAMLAGLGGGAAAYLVAGLFNTLTLKTSHTVLFWAFLGLIELIGDRRPWRASSRSREGRVAVPAAAALVALFGALWAVTLGNADAAFIEGMSTRDASARERSLRESIEINPFAWRPHYELSKALSTMGRPQGAAEEGRATLRLRPHQLDALNHTAIALNRAGGADREVEELFRRTVEIAPYYHRSLYNFGQFERQRGNREEARRWYTRAIEHKPDHEASYFCRGLLAYAGGDATMAIEDFRKARALGVDIARELRAERPSAESDPRLAEFFR